LHLQWCNHPVIHLEEERLSFEQLISITPLGDATKPKYLVIADDLAQSILSGQFAMGEKLPPQRNLALRLGVTAGTISRAYANLERRGLASARVGDGTYVRAVERSTSFAPAELQAAPIDLAHNVAILTDDTQALKRTFDALSASPDTLRQVLSYQPETGLLRHRKTGSQWLKRFGTSGDWNRVMITHGAQHGLACILRTLARPGDAVLTESLSYPGLLALARSMRLQLIGVAMDSEGMVPQALERAAKTFDIKFMYCSPSLHNPTGSTMSISRREEIAAVARKCNLLVIEDVVHAAAQASPLPALSTWLPERSFLLSSFSKVIAPGLRIGFLEAAPEWLDKLAASIRDDSWMVAPLMPEIASHWIESGEMEYLIGLQRKTIQERLAIANTVLVGIDFQSDSEYPLLWMPLPDPWRAGQFSAALRHAGVLVRTADHFAVGRSAAPHAIRISLNSPQTTEQMVSGLNTLKSLIHSPPAASMDP
jgi:DNA-binding transcriptional MocR family regulator